MLLLLVVVVLLLSIAAIVLMLPSNAKRQGTVRYDAGFRSARVVSSKLFLGEASARRLRLRLTERVAHLQF